jgi:uncharacterized membrane protein
VAEVVGLLVLILAVLFLALPILTFIRLGRLGQEIEELRERVRMLERSPTPRTSAAQAPRESAQATVATPAVDVPRDEVGVPYVPRGRVVVPPPLPEPTLQDSTPHEPPLHAPFHDAAFHDSVDAIPDVATDDLEDRIGGRGLLYAGILVLLIGVSFFLKYAFDSNWINETGRVVLGAMAGIGLIAGGLRFAHAGLTVFGHGLTGAGVAVLYLAVYAAVNFYALISNQAGFGLMIAVTIAAAVLADRQRSQPLAIIAVGGGFLTPFLVGGDENAQLTLFSYVALLIGATLLLSLRHQWVALNALSYVFTYVTVLTWASRYYTERQWLRTLLFLTLFAVLYLIILRETRRIPGSTARVVAALLATGPVLYHFSAVMITAQHPPAIHIYLIAVTVVGLWLTAEPHRPWLRLAVLFAALIPMFGALTLPNGLSWIVPNVITIIAVAALHFVALIDRVARQNEILDTPEHIAIHVAGIGLFGLLYAILQPAYPEWRGGIAALLALGAVGFWRWLGPRDPMAALNAAALAFTLAALAVAVQLDGPAAVVGWAAEGAAAIWLGLRARNRPFQIGGLGLFTLATARLLDDYFVTPAAFVGVVNARAMTTLFVVVLGYALAWMFVRYPMTHSRHVRTALHIACSVLTVMWVTAEIRSFWEVRYTSPQAYLYQHVMLSLAWALYGAVMISIGMWRRYPLARYIGMTVIAATTLKVFFYDLWELGGIYRVIGLIGFSVLLLLVSYLYQKRRMLRPPSAASEPNLDAGTPPAADTPAPLP